jgi:hypothetical protein
VCNLTIKRARIGWPVPPDGNDRQTKIELYKSLQSALDLTHLLGGLGGAFSTKVGIQGLINKISFANFVVEKMKAVNFFANQ